MCVRLQKGNEEEAMCEPRSDGALWTFLWVFQDGWLIPSLSWDASAAQVDGAEYGCSSRVELVFSSQGHQ